MSEYRIKQYVPPVGPDTAVLWPSSTFNVQVTHGLLAHLTIVYSYYLPWKRFDPATPEGQRQQIRIAEEEQMMIRAADSVVTRLFAGSGVSVRLPALDTLRIASRQEFESYCK
jgi:hypothetical protein